MPFGVKSGPAPMQHLMWSIFGHLENKYITINLDNILVYYPNKEQQEKDLPMVFQPRPDKDCHLWISKCELFKEKVNFIAFEISHGKVSQNISNTQAILDHRTPNPSKVNNDLWN
jgi:hypothetical protein